MLLAILAFLGGALTILSPCVLPVLPFVFARADRPFLRSGLPQLAGMAVSFAVVATLAAFAGGAAVEADRYARFAAMALLALSACPCFFRSSLIVWRSRSSRLAGGSRRVERRRSAAASPLRSFLALRPVCSGRLARARSWA